MPHNYQKLPELTVFLPAYNLEHHIKKTVENTYKYLPEAADKYEVIVINDGSQDQTEKILEQLQKKYSTLRIISHEQNRGYGGALKSGIYNAKYKWITFTDADGQFEFGDIFSLISTMQKTKADMVVGYYLKRAVSFQRKLNTWLWQQVVNILFSLNIRDIDCGFKLFKKEIIETISKLESGRGAFISSEFLIKAKKAGFNIQEVGVHHYPRTAGKGTGADINVIINSFVDLFKLWLKLK